MKKENVELFFDNLAPSWDNMECHTDEEKRKLLDQLNIKINDQIIDIACGTGVITSLLHDYSKTDITAIDISENMINIAKEKYKDKPWAHFYKQDLMSLDENKKYDYAIIYNAYPHFLNPEILAIKLSWILQKNGHFAILHSLGRNELNAHHSGKASSVSRDILEVNKEASFFKEFFDIEIAKEDEHSIIIVGRKK